MDQRMEWIEKGIESLTTNQNEILSQINLMFEKLNARIDQLSSQAANDKAEDFRFLSKSKEDRARATTTHLKLVPATTMHQNQ